MHPYVAFLQFVLVSFISVHCSFRMGFLPTKGQGALPNKSGFFLPAFAKWLFIGDCVIVGGTLSILKCLNNIKLN